MTSRFVPPWDTNATDGAFSPIGIALSRNDDDEIALYGAWLKERRDNIESSYLLDRASKFLARMLNDEDLDVARRKMARSLLEAIRAARAAKD